eukprot:scaffold162097_cov66-Cyclotella_meneghiniana.AAC.1
MWYALQEWKPFLQNSTVSKDDWGDKRASACHLRNGAGYKVWEQCSVDPADFEEHFPIQPGKHIPPSEKK